MNFSWRQAILQPPSEDGTALELREARQALSAARTRFEMLSDDDLITASIHEMEALEARCRYLLRLARQEGVCAAFPCPQGYSGIKG